MREIWQQSLNTSTTIIKSLKTSKKVIQQQENIKHWLGVQLIFSCSIFDIFAAVALDDDNQEAKKKIINTYSEWLAKYFTENNI